MITIQYLEPFPELAQLSPETVVAKLRLAFERLPFSHLLIGWDLPDRLLEACRKEALQLDVRFLRWHPLLTGDGVFQPQPAWQVVGLTGKRVPGFQNMPEFTFVCPNHPQVQEAIEQRIDDLLRLGFYQGFFLDRVRFPSPASHPQDDLGCFCEHCQRKAISFGIDLEHTRTAILEMTAHPAGRLKLVEILMGRQYDVSRSQPAWGMLANFLDFRCRSITEFVQRLSRQLKGSRMEIGLDCFSPSLVRMVGQDLRALSRITPAVDWIKIMSYAHTHGPAGIPFEYLGLLDYLTTDAGLNETKALNCLFPTAEANPPGSRKALAGAGFSARALEHEVRSGLSGCEIPVLAGLELVEIKGVAHLNDKQITADLVAVQRAGAAGLALSWDLWHMPIERLDVVRSVYLGN
jgi:hypothetical protein